MRKLKVKWTQRNIDRVHKFLKIDSDWYGNFKRNGQVIGYKIVSPCNQYMTFNFIDARKAFSEAKKSIIENRLNTLK